MSWYLALGSCIDYTREFETEEEGLEYIRSQKHPTAGMTLYKLEYGFTEAGKEDEDEAETP